MSSEETKKLYESLNKMPYDDTDDLLNANGVSGDNFKPTVVVTQSAPVNKPDYFKYAMVGVLVLLIGNVVYKNFNKPQ
jgi:hypothetical protein